MFKKISLSLSIIMVLCTIIFTGCSAPTPIPTPAPATIRFVYQQDIADYETLAVSFHQLHPMINIELIPVNAYENYDTFISQVQTADVVRADSRFSPPDIISGSLPLDSLIEGDPTFPVADFFPGTLPALRLGDQQMGIPAGMNPYITAYDVEIFARSGVTPPALDWRLNDLLEAALAVNNRELNGEPVPLSELAYGFCTYPVSDDPVLLTYLFGGGLFDDIHNPTRPTLDSAENITAMTWYASLKHEYGVMSPSGLSANYNVYRGYLGTFCGLWLQWLYDIPSLGQSRAHEIGILPLPHADNSNDSAFNIVILDSYHIMQKSIHQEEAWLWISYLIQQQTASGKLIPPVQSLIASDEYASRVASTELTIARQLNADTVVLGYEMTNQEAVNISIQLYLQAVEKIINQGINPLTALSEAQSEAVKAFAGQMER